MSLPLSFSAKVSNDLKEILRHYEQEGGSRVADGFYAQLEIRIAQIRENPLQFPYFSAGIRRTNLDRFPYHLLYRVKPSGIYIFVLRHDRRNPNYGMRRQ